MEPRRYAIPLLIFCSPMLYCIAGCGRLDQPEGKVIHVKKSDFVKPKSPPKAKSPLCQCKDCTCDPCECGKIAEQPKDKNAVPIADNPVRTDLADSLEKITTRPVPETPRYTEPAAVTEARKRQQGDCVDGQCFAPQQSTGTYYEAPRRGLFGRRR